MWESFEVVIQEQSEFLISLWTGVSTVPVEKDHMEEMITRCIVEVLSNALSKPNAPPINPECKEILKKGGKTDRERSEDKQLEVRHLKEPSEFEDPHSESVEREQSQEESDSKKRMKGSDEEKLHPGEGNSKEDEEGQHIPVREEKLHTEEKKIYQEIGREENSYHSEEESKESKQSDEEVDRAVLNKKSHSAGMSTEEVTEKNDQRPMDHWHSEEGVESPYKRIREGEEKEAEEERSEKYHLSESKGRDFSQHNEQEESDENEEVEEEKKSYKPKRYHGKNRMGDSSEENRGRGGEKEELAEESNVEESHLWDKRNHHQKHHHEESKQQHEEKNGYRGRHGSEGMEKRRVGQGSVEYRERWQQNEEKSQVENKRHRNSEESNEKWHEEGRHHSEGRAYRGDESEEELDRYHSDSSKEKQHHVGGRYRLWDDEGEGTLKAYTQERKGQARTHYNTEDNVEQQHYPGNSDEEEEEVEKKHYSSDQIENEEESMEQGYAEKEEYRSHLPAENEKRTTASYSPLYPLLWWKSRHFEKRNSAGERLPESEEESRPTLSEKNLFPEYSDYDWWDKKQLLSALNRGRSEKRNLSKRNRYDMKRQYDKMDQLAQLLNYRKKSAEFLELYNSGEDMKKRHGFRNDKGTLNQRPLTEEEAKELENLAAMDLELQKIAETFNDNRRG
ncbi:secretogranin-1 isoform X1 [Phasianus colchicus]|uniref:Secretogranin-1 n=1 Tax=Phasianus colchicus TaxID=9054 RepID=A0A669P010_PHACC|nr:secretogranin-1 isoform X1 [Phasianus colchicus]